MGSRIGRLLQSCVVVLIAGCAAALIPYQSDPDGKLGAADALVRDNRPLPAERLIQEAIEQYIGANNQIGLSKAYTAYSMFFRTRAVADWADHYRKYGFLDKRANFDHRVERSLFYLERARDVLPSASGGRITNLELRVAQTWEILGSKPQACLALARSLAAHVVEQASKTEPVVLPEGFKTYEAFINSELTRLGCSD